MTQTVAPVSAGEYPASVWLPWYFTRGPWSVLTVPLFFVLFVCVLWTTLAAAVQGVGLFRVMYAVYGFLGIAAIVFGLWLPLVMPPAIYFSLLKNLPTVWMRADGNAGVVKRLVISVAVLLILPFVAQGCTFAISRGMGWVADRDPCAAYAVGVAGSIPPTNCR